MGRLIDVDALPDHKFPEVQCNGFGEGAAYRQGWNDAIDAIVENEPPVDAVSVVRCKDCKFFSHGYCRFHDAKFVRPDGYCYWGERKEGEQA